MRKLLLLLLVVALLPMAAVAQDVESNWEFDMVFPTDDPAHIINNHFGVHGLVVDNQNRVWIQTHYGRPIDEGIPNSAHIRIYNEDGTEADFSPLYQAVIGDSTHVWASGAGRGMRLDHEGNVLVSWGSTLYRFNGETGEPMGFHQFAHGPLTSVGVDEIGNILVPAVLNDRVLPIYDESMQNLIVTVTEERPGIARSANFSKDGTRAYVPLLGESGGYVLTYESEFGPFGTYTPVEPIVVGVHAEAIAIAPDDVLWLSAGNAADGVNVMEGDSIDTNWQLGHYYGFDQETGELVDYMVWEGEEEAPHRPRGLAFSPDGKYAYIGSFEGVAGDPGVQRFRYVGGGVSAEPIDGTPTSFSLDQNYPNPFNSSTTIEFSIVESGDVTLKVYDVLGREVATLQDGPLTAGEYKVNFEAGDIASGTYIYVLENAGNRQSKTMVLLK